MSQWSDMSGEQAVQDEVAWAVADDTDWDRVYADQLPRVYNFFRFRIRHQADVEDLTARTFEKAWRARHSYRSDVAGFSTWLFRIARNVAIDHVRASKEFLPIEAAEQVELDGTPEVSVSLGSDLTRLAALTATLPERERELLALKYGAAMTNRAIARLTELSESNVGTILSRTVERLRAQW